MNKKLGLAVAGALLALSSTANAGITIPAGDWTLDIGGVVNAYYTSTREKGEATALNGASAQASQTTNNITTGLLPNYLTVSGKSRQNDLDIAFTISIQPGAATSTSGTLGSLNQRQAFLTVGDASWGSVKFGKDLGIFASDAILNDMTLLGVGQGAAAVGNTTLGRIGAGYMYADWKSQIAYTSPNMNGFQFTAGVTQSWDAVSNLGSFSAESDRRGGSQSAYEGKASYSWTGDVAGKVWTSFLSQKVKGVNVGGSSTTELDSTTASAWDVGTNVNVAGLGLTGYYSKGKGIGQTFLMHDGLDATGKKRDSKDWYLQATYSLPTATKLGLSYGESKLEGTSVADNGSEITNEMWTVGAYHPLTKSLNLVAE
jgi:predicted porin